MQISNTFLTKISGVDISAYQGKIDWQRVKQSGIQFVFAKATEGATFKDKTFRDNILRAREAGLLCGAYHFFRPQTAIRRQVDNFVSSVQLLGMKPLPALDLEVPSDWKDIQKADRIKLVVDWLAQVESILNLQPVIYLSSSFPGDILSNTESLAKYPLWLAHYTKQPTPKVPYPWQQYTFWQHTDKGAVDGIMGNVDLDRFDGSITELERLMLGHSL